MFGFFSHIPARILVAVVLCAALVEFGCTHQAAKSTPPVLVPSIETQPQPVPAPQPEPSENSSAATQATPDDSRQQNAQKPKPKPRKPAPRKPEPEPAKAEPPKPEPARPPFTPDNSVQITADVPRAAVQSQKQNTEQLLRNSATKLDHLTRPLSDGEQGMARQARNYIAQSNQALQSGDIERAFNLAVKASLLANELAK
jgi:outer membrane biosynthesis protein TonB